VVLANPVVNIPIAFGSVQVDRRVSMRIVLSRSLWLQGKPDQALEVMQEAVEIAPEDGPHAICHALSQAACPISLWRGDADAIDTYVERLLEVSSRFTLNHWNSWGQMYAKFLAQSGGGRLASYGKRISTEGDLQVHTLATLNGQMEGIDLSDNEIAGRTGWAAPEILRRHGISLVGTNDRQALELFERSLEIARSQGALAWELRTVTSLAVLLARNGERPRAALLLGEVCDRFTEGFDTADLVVATKLRAQLQIL
jgi:tetratricopeptide (TPR) repeat protein